MESLSPDRRFYPPWLLRFFDQIRFYPVSAQELQKIRRDFPLGNYPLQIESTTFTLADYQLFLQQHSGEIEQFQRQRQAAFAQELAQWKRDGQLTYQQDEIAVPQAEHEELPEGMTGIDTPCRAACGVCWCNKATRRRGRCGDDSRIHENGN